MYGYFLVSKMYGYFLLFSTLFLATSGVKHSNPPNIIVIVADDMGINDVSYRGSNLIPTPNIDALAYSGRILNRHYSPPICTPSRSAYFTGRYPIKLGTQGYVLLGGQPNGVSLDFKLLPEYLKELGYKTHMVGKWHLGFSSNEYLPFKRGFDTYLGYYNGYLGYYLLDANQTLVDGSGDRFYGFDMHDETGNPRWDLKGEYATKFFTEDACDVIRKHNASNGPLYLHVAHLAPHTGTEIGNGLETAPGMDVNKTFSKIETYERRLYAGLIKGVDDSVGKIVQELGRSNLLENSIILFMSDHGAPSVSTSMQPNFGSNWPLRGTKFTLYDGGVRSAAVIWSPLLKGGILDERLYHVTDWLPTFISAAGGNPNVGSDGIDQWKSLRNPQHHGPRSDLLLNIDEEKNTEGVIFDNRWKLVKQNYGDLANYDFHIKTQQDYSNFSHLFDQLKSSAAGKEIKKLTGEFNFHKLYNLRKRAIIDCGFKVEKLIPMGQVPPSEDFYCKDYCLFDLIKDPCETRRIENREDLFSKGKQLLDEWRKFLVPQFSLTIDPKSNPVYFEGVWTPWLK